MAPKSKIATDLSPADKAEFDRLLATGRMSVDGLTLWLEGKGYRISRSAVGRYSQSFEKVAAKLRQSREMTEALVREVGPSAAESQHGRLLVEILRKLTFDHLMQRLEDDGGEGEGEGSGAMEAGDFFFLAKALKEMAGAARLDQDYEAKVREQANKKAAAVATDAIKEAGLSDEMANAIAKKILGAQT